MKRLSIRWRVTLWNTAAFAVVLVGFGLLVYGLLRQTHYDQVDGVLTARYSEMLSDEQIAQTPAKRFQFWVKRFGKHVEIIGVGLTAMATSLLRPSNWHPSPHRPSRSRSAPHRDSTA